MKAANKLRLTFNVIQLIAKYSPEYFLIFVPQIVLISVLSLLNVYMPKLIIDALVQNKKYPYIAQIILLFCVVSLVFNILIKYIETKNTLCVERFSKKMSDKIGQFVMDLELSRVENTKEKDNIRLAGNASGTIALLEVIKNLIQSVFTLVGFIVIVSKLSITFFLIVFVIVLVRIIFITLNYKFGTKLRVQVAQNNRVGDYLSSLCYFNPGAAKEIRTNSLHEWFLGKVVEFRKIMIKFQYNEFGRNLLFDSVNAVIYAISSFYILWCLANYYMNGVISIGDFTLYFTTITSMISILVNIAGLVTQYNRHIQNVSDFKRLENLMTKEENHSLSSNLSQDIESDIVIEFSNVCFAYPGTVDYVLKNINITINNGEKLVIVGYNGAGKSTFIKLLCKFYRPSSGIITLNGKDIWKIPNSEYYKLLSAVFQDYATLAFTISENICMSNEQENLSEIIKNVGLSDFIDRLPERGKTYISKRFSSDGIELSGGQEQKIALARAVYKNAPVLILDEPTASLDVKAENDLYENFIKNSINKTVIFISHRLAVSQIADKIAVFSEGRIVEYGTHKELVNSNRIYAEMFRKQSEPYLEDVESLDGV